MSVIRAVSVKLIAEVFEWERWSVDADYPSSFFLVLLLQAVFVYIRSLKCISSDQSEGKLECVCKSKKNRYNNLWLPRDIFGRH